MKRPLATIAASVLAPFVLAVSLACSATPSGTEVAAPEGLEFRTEAPAGDATATEFRHGESLLRLGPPQRFAMERAFATVDALGLPAVGFEVAAADRARFTEWTGSIVGQRLAVFVDGALIAAPHVEDPLPGEGIISGGPGGFTAGEVEELLAALAPEAD